MYWGDEPLIPQSIIDQVAETRVSMRRRRYGDTTRTYIVEEVHLFNPNTVKLVAGWTGKCAIFSRIIPYLGSR